MPNIYRALGATSAVVIPELSKALTNKYSTGVTIHYTDINNIVFTCAAISTKTIKMYVSNNTRLILSYGDAWTGGSSITNAVTVLSHYYSDSQVSGVGIVLGDSFILVSLDLVSYGHAMYAIIGLDSVGNSIAAGFGQSVGDYYDVSAITTNITTGELIHFVSPTPFLSPTGEIYKLPLQLFGVSSKRILLDGSSNPITIPGLKMSSYSTKSGMSLVLPGMFISQSGCKGSAGKNNVLECGILAEL